MQIQPIVNPMQKLNHIMHIDGDACDGISYKITQNVARLVRTV